MLDPTQKAGSAAPHKRSLALKSDIFQNLSLHLDDVEFLQNAFVVQAITGPLVRFSNRGRYEPYVASEWTQAGNSWVFRLHEGLSCEDGQPINSNSFRASLKGSLRRFSFDELKQTPFINLLGIGEFLKGGDDSNLGIRAGHNELELAFDRPVGKGLLEYLAMTPFSFLCESNFSGDKWISQNQFKSSGPYRVAQFDRETGTCRLELRKDWPLNPPNAFETVFLSRPDQSPAAATAEVTMSYGRRKGGDSKEQLVMEVPRALLSVRLGCDAGRFFSNRVARQTLHREIRRQLEKTKIPFENYHRAESVFFAQVTGHESLGAQISPTIAAPSKPLKIRAEPAGGRPEVDFFQNVLFDSLRTLGWAYEIDTTPVAGLADYHSRSYDVVFDRSHVDATFDPDFVRILFQSKLGPKYPDPGDRVARLVEDFDANRLTYRDFLIQFNAIVAEESALIPLFHRGFAWTFSADIDTLGISPLMSILRFEELAAASDGGN